MDTEGKEAVTNSEDLEVLTARQALRRPRYYLVWLIMFINITAGIMLLSVASPMLQAITGANVATAASIVGLIGIFNGGVVSSGRPPPTTSDERPRTRRSSCSRSPRSC